jgi:hypothetical protein
LHLEPIANFDDQRPPPSVLRNWPLIAEWGRAMKKKDRIGEREYQGRLRSLLKSAFNTQLQLLRSLETATKKRRALKMRAAKNSGFTKSRTTASG